MGQGIPPKVFLSHASEDKERFVMKFAKKLRLGGIDVWVDEWEMLPGDSLVQKIFDEGIKQAEAFIVVLSSISVKKRWVKEELDAGLVKKINTGTKLIPVIIDDCNIPTALNATIHVRIENLDHFDEELNRIISAILGTYEKPPIGIPPKYSTAHIRSISGLNDIDTVVLSESCNYTIERGLNFLETVEIWGRVQVHEIPESEFLDSLNVLRRNGYIDYQEHTGDRGKVAGGMVSAFTLTQFGFNEFAEVYIEDYEDIIKAVAYELANSAQSNNATIADKIDRPIIIIDFILDLLEGRNLVQLSKTLGAGTYIYNISPEIRRSLK